MNPTQKTSTASLVSVASGLSVFPSVGLLWPPILILILSMLAIVSGHVALAAIRRDPDRITGKAFAITGLFIGYTGLIAGVAAFVLLNAAFMSFGGR